MATKAPVLRSASFGTKAVAGKYLKSAATFWFGTALAGQLVFALYIAAFYGGAAARGEPEKWNQVLAHGVIAGDLVGNIALAVHLALAFVITISGPLQLMPQLRSRAPAFHRWNGRVYIATAYVISLSALYLIWARDGLPGWSPLNSVAISVNAILIMLFAAVALRHALHRDIAAHRRWALRLFMVVSGVWFLRVGVMLWILANGGPVGLGENLAGPAGIGLTFAQYLLPLAALELYLRVQASPSIAARFAFAAVLAFLTCAMGVGIVMAAMFMWLPHI